MSSRLSRILSPLRAALSVLFVVPLLLVVSGCSQPHFSGSETSTGQTSTAAPTVSLVASPASIGQGSSSTLTLTASNAMTVTLTGSDGSSYTMPVTGATQVVTPSATTTYTATVTGLNGQVTAQATISVAAAAPPTISITANPTSVTPGIPSTLTIEATNATSVKVSGSDGTSFTLPAAGGTHIVSPSATTTYTASATGAGGSVSASAKLTVEAAVTPTVTISATPASIAPGATSTLTVGAANATGVTVSGSDGTTFTLGATGGTHVVTPSVTTTYIASATGTSGKATASTTITVIATGAAPTVSIAANPTSIASGGSSTLSVTATNASQVTISGSDGSSYPLSPTGGTQVVRPASTATYTVTATGSGGSITSAATVTVLPAPTVTIAANPASVVSGSASTLTVTATNATQVTVAGTDGSSYTLAATGGTQSVSPVSTTTYTATATGTGGSTTATAVVTVRAPGSVNSINHVVFMLQENHSFDNYFGMLNPYRKTHNWNIGDDGKDYEVDGIDDKLTTISNVDDEGTEYKPYKLATTCIDDESSDWLASYGDTNRYNFLATRPIVMDGFVHDAEGYAKNCASTNSCSGSFTDLTGQRAMGYYDQSFLNYYYYMASQFAVSNRWFSPMSSKSIPNRIANMGGGTTQGLAFDPGADDHLNQLAIPTIFQSLDAANVTWKIYYTVTEGYCLNDDDCGHSANAYYPDTTFSYFTYSYQYLHSNPTGTCAAPTVPSSVVGDASNSFCIDPNHIAPLSTYFTDLTNGTLPAFSFIEAGYANNDEHPGSGQSILSGQAQVASVINAFMTSPEWSDSVFFLSYDEGGGPYDHVPPVPGHSNDNTDTSLGTIPDVSTIAVNPDSYNPCQPSGGAATTHCDLSASDPGAHSGDAAAIQGFSAQLGFRVPNMVISPFTRRHYISNAPMDHTAVIKFVENRFIGPSAHLTARDAAQPNLLDFFDFNAVPWATPPTPPSPVTPETLGYDPCRPGTLQ